MFASHGDNITPPQQALNWIVDVPVLENLLADAVRFQPLIEVHTDAQTAALTVVCEGRASRTREEFAISAGATK